MARAEPSEAEPDVRGQTSKPAARFQSTSEGIISSALVTEDTVFFGDVAGWFYALHRATGAERWKLNSSDG